MFGATALLYFPDPERCPEPVEGGICWSLPVLLLKLITKIVKLSVAKNRKRTDKKKYQVVQVGIVESVSLNLAYFSQDPQSANRPETGSTPSDL